MIVIPEHDNCFDNLDDYLDCLYNSDYNGPPEVEEQEKIYFEEAISAVADRSSAPVLSLGRIVIIEEGEQ